MMTIGLLTFTVYISRFDNSKTTESFGYQRQTSIKNQGDKLKKVYSTVFIDPDTTYIMVTLDENSIGFDFNSYTLNDTSQNILIPLAKEIEPNNLVKIYGYTCNIGDYDYNIYLSSKRAQSVKNYIQYINLSITNIQTFGLGESNPIADNNTSFGRKRNRRVEIKLENNPPPDFMKERNAIQPSNIHNDKIILLLTKYNTLIIILSLIASIIQIYDFGRRIISY
jgi:outer membrane protein OmpA-like peptidoglycan-associated protein